MVVKNNILKKLGAHLSKAMTICERYKYIESLQEDLPLNKEAYLSWTNRKSALSDEDKSLMLKINSYNINIFSNCVYKDFEVDYNNIDGLKWVQEIAEIFSDEHLEKLQYDKEMGYTNVIQIFLLHIKKRISDKLDLLNYKFNNNKLLNILLESSANRLLRIALKTIVLELNIDKSQNKIAGNTPEDRREDFLSKFADINELLSFFEKYPVLLRKLSGVSNLYINFIVEMLDRLNKKKDEIAKFLDYNGKIDELEVDNLRLDSGDTHQGGRAVAIVEFNAGTLVYKPRDMQVKSAFAEIMELFQSDDLLNIHIPDTLFCGSYAFEKFIEHKHCKSQTEVENYYTRFGQLVALIYLTNGNDMHHENIIAMGEYPVIVDYETIITNSVDLNTVKESALEQLQHKLRNSIMGSYLLPQKMVLDAKGTAVDMSAFDISDQSFQSKSYTPIDLDKDTARYERQVISLQKEKNRVYLNNSLVDPFKYAKQITIGSNSVFKNFSKIDKTEFESIIAKYKNVVVRVLTRGTNVYAQFLEYTYHPSCMRDMLESEKILENLFAYPFKNKKICHQEYIDIVDSDIPMFVSKLGSNSLFSSRGVEIKEVSENNIQQLLTEKWNSVDENDICLQNELIKFKLNIPQDNIRKVDYIASTADNIKLSEAIAGSLLNSAKVDDTSKTIAWITLNHSDVQGDVVDVSNCNFHDGLAGLALYYYYLYKCTGNEKYAEVALYCYNTCAKSVRPVEHSSAYIGHFSLLYTSMVFEREKFCMTQVKEYINNTLNLLNVFATESIDTIFLKSGNKSEEVAWLTGTASIISLLLDLYNSIGDDDIKYNICIIADKSKVVVEENLDSYSVGFAQGLSGLVLAYYKLYKVTGINTYLQFVKKLSSIRSSKFRDDVNNLEIGWHDGLVGYATANLELIKIGAVDDIASLQEELDIIIEKMKEFTSFGNETLSSGKLGVVDFLIEVSEFTNNFELLKLANSIFDSIKDDCSSNGNFELLDWQFLRNISLWSGLAGVGYTALRLNSNNADVFSVTNFGLRRAVKGRL
ncbi:MAG: type 2 lantipeptide synthetase LanM [Candidatus Ancillula sp.]|jgi:type 2 lantibiotic biosynthesis protein LanM|nr:type 2 lantipeptide synthetase LanM [Candidatus Ancillula sp.]